MITLYLNHTDDTVDLYEVFQFPTMELTITECLTDRLDVLGFDWGDLLQDIENLKSDILEIYGCVSITTAVDYVDQASDDMFFCHGGSVYLNLQ